MHPSSVLYGGTFGAEPVTLPVCDHFAGNEALLRKSLAQQAQLGPVFDITADCEQSAPTGREAEHAIMVGRLIASPENRHDRVGVRIHDPSHRNWHSDLEHVIRAAGARLAYVTVPKIEHLEALERVVAAVDDVAQQCGVRREIPIHAVIETHGGLHAAWQLAAHPRVECLAFGLIDYVAGFGGALPPDVLETPGQFDNPVIRRAKTAITIAAHSSGKVASHNVCIDIANPQSVLRDATRASADFGFTRMWSIHPSQIQPIVQALRPDAALIRQATDILLAGQADAWQPSGRGGRLHDRASYRYWWSVLRRAHATGALLPGDATHAFFSDARPSQPRNSR